MMKPTPLSATMMEETVVLMQTQIIVLNAFATFKNFVLLDFIYSQLETVSAMMKPTMPHAIMMAATVVEMPTQITVLNALVFSKRLVLLDFFLFQLEMVSAMMKTTMLIATSMDLIAVDLLSTQRIVQNAYAIVSCKSLRKFSYSQLYSWCPNFWSNIFENHIPISFWLLEVTTRLIFSLNICINLKFQVVHTAVYG